MKRVAIITINDYNNYGNRLQNYATQEVVKTLGFKVKTIVNKSIYKNNNSIVNNLIEKVQKNNNRSNKDKYKLVITKIWNWLNRKTQFERTKVFKEFTNNYISETDYCISDDNIPEDLSDRFDFFITGSDQVWNPIFRLGSFINFLTFAPKHKRIAYAPSFGISVIPEEYVENYSLWLSQIENLSVREEVGAQIIKELTGRDAIVLVDPTIMLSKAKWLSISKEAPNKPKKPYLLTYFIGEISKEKKKRIGQIAFANKLEIINLVDFKDKNSYITGPSEFIDYINSTNIFFTDSFHGAVFSILLEKPFIIFDRIEDMVSMNSRIDTLLLNFNLNSRKWKSTRNGIDIFNIDYSHVTPILESERKKALNYLEEALCVKEES